MFSRRRELIAGERSVLPAGFKKCKYIESSGTQYILTDIVPKDTYPTDIELTFCITDNETVDLYRDIFGAAEHNYQNSFRFGYRNNQYAFARWYGGSVSKTGTIDSQWHTVIITDQNMKLDNGAPVKSEGRILESDAYTRIAVFAINVEETVQGHSKVMLSGFKVKNNGTEIADFVPCYDTLTGKAGLYDLCGSVCEATGTPFYTNAGTGEFGYEFQSGVYFAPVTI